MHPPRSPAERRRPLLNHMRTLAAQGHTCAACTGICCTFARNSMQITPLETQDLVDHLRAEQRLQPQLLDRLDATIQHFRLDQPLPGNGQRTFTRRRYTCPFFANTQPGCTIAPEAKPYGCLGYNPNQPHLDAGQDCSSTLPQLEALEQNDAPANQALARRHNLTWDKLPIPLALRQFLSL